MCNGFSKNKTDTYGQSLTHNRKNVYKRLLYMNTVYNIYAYYNNIKKTFKHSHCKHTTLCYIDFIPFCYILLGSTSHFFEKF